MVKGFYVALDTDIDVDHVKWWKTTAGYLAPYDRMFIAKQPTDFHGVWLNTAAPPEFPAAVAQARRRRAAVLGRQAADAPAASRS